MAKYLNTSIQAHKRLWIRKDKCLSRKIWIWIDDDVFYSRKSFHKLSLLVRLVKRIFFLSFGNRLLYRFCSKFN